MALLKSDSDNVLNIKTVQITAFRILMTALKDIMLESNITFTNEGIKIVNMDKSHTILVHLNLEAKNFEVFDIKKDKIVIAVNMIHLFKLISTIDNNETLTIYIEENDYNDGIVEYLSLRFENPDINQFKIQKLKLIEPDQYELNIPIVSYNYIINILSTDFQKIVRDLSNVSEKLEIKAIDKTLIFKCAGNFAQAEIIRTESEGNMSFLHVESPDTIVQGEYSLKNLSYFIKCTNLCNHVEIKLGNNLPIIIKYSVASLGEIELCLVPLPPSNEV